VGLVVLAVFRAGTFGQTVTIELPDLVGPLEINNPKMQVVDLGVTFLSIEEVRFGCSGTITPGLGCGDGVERPVFPYFEMPGEIEGYMNTDPGFWSCWIGPYDGYFSDEETFRGHFHPTWDFLLDGQGQVVVSLVTIGGVGIVMLVPPTATITEAWLTVRGTMADVIEVLSPNGGEHLGAGSTYRVEWTDIRGGQTCSATYLLDYSVDNGQTWLPMDMVDGTCDCDCVLPSVISEQCLVRVSDACDPNVTDTSDSVFCIYECQAHLSNDYNDDCYLDFRDFAIMAEEWYEKAADLDDLEDLADEWCKCGNPFDPLCEY
jgi:hypothetical protein